MGFFLYAIDEKLDICQNKWGVLISHSSVSDSEWERVKTRKYMRVLLYCWNKYKYKIKLYEFNFVCGVVWSTTGTTMGKMRERERETDSVTGILKGLSQANNKFI